jgi:sulfopyruvate decarboxylase TPP-binding subunit
VAAALRAAGVSDVIWIPDSDLGRWEAALSSTPGLRLLRVCREGEAIALAAGLHLGGRQPLVLIQCTGLFEAGDSLRNCVHDLNLPLFLVVGVRSWHAHQEGKSADTCPRFTEPILRAWQIPYVFLDPQRQTPDDLAAAYRAARDEKRAGAALLAE